MLARDEEAPVLELWVLVQIRLLSHQTSGDTGVLQKRLKLFRILHLRPLFEEPVQFLFMRFPPSLSSEPLSVCPSGIPHYPHKRPPLLVTQHGNSDPAIVTLTTVHGMRAGTIVAIAS